MLLLRSREARVLSLRSSVRGRPRCSGLKELRRRRVLRLRSLVWREVVEDCESVDRERLVRFPCASWAGRRGGGEREGERLVEMVDTESAEDEGERERERLRAVVRPRSWSFFLRMSSATPFLRTRSLGTSVVSLGWSCGLSSCWVREGRDL